MATTLFAHASGTKRCLLGIVHRVTEKRVSTIPIYASQKQLQWRGRCTATTSCCHSMTGCLGSKPRDQKQQRQRTHRCYSDQKEIDTNSEASISTSSRQFLWGEMTPETRRLARSILSQRLSIHADDDFGCNECDSNDSGDGKKGSNQQTAVQMHPRVAISRAITLMESKHRLKKKQGDLLLTYLLSLSSCSSTSLQQNKSGNTTDSAGAEAQPSLLSTETLRIGFAGPPGAGKSSLMEAFGMKLLQEDPAMKLAVVCIDPSSNISGGSILGDKTRMTRLSRQTDRALVRPSSNSGILGGLAAYTDDVVRLLTCAGYPLVFVETVGLGQSEIEVAQSVDVLVLLIPPSGGDELQGVKKGIVEMADILAITKTDGELEAAANQTAADYKGALRVLHQSHSGSGSNGDKWIPPVVRTSSVTELGLEDLWLTILRYQQHLLTTGNWGVRRRKQVKYWMWKQLSRMIQNKMKDDPTLNERANELERKMLDGLLTPRVSAQVLMEEMFETEKK